VRSGGDRNSKDRDSGRQKKNENAETREKQRVKKVKGEKKKRDLPRRGNRDEKYQRKTAFSPDLAIETRDLEGEGRHEIRPFGKGLATGYEFKGGRSGNPKPRKNQSSKDDEGRVVRKTTPRRADEIKHSARETIASSRRTS